MKRFEQEPVRTATRDRPGWRSPWRRRAVIALLAVAILVAGCERGDAGEEGMTAGKFVEVVTAVREAERAVAWEDSAGALFAERKAEILAREGVTETELRAFMAAQDASRLERLWEVIAQRLRHVPGQVSEPVQPTPDGELPVEPGAEPRVEPRAEPPRPGPPRRGPPSFQAPPIPVDTGERRLH